MTLEALDPPASLDAEALAIWRETAPHVVALGAPAALAHLLEAYCRHVVAARRIGRRIAEMQQAGRDDTAELSRLLTTHTKAAVDLGKQLGLV